MRVESIMSRHVVCCRRTDSLAEAALAMWNHDIGCVPVIDDQGHVVGIVTDRDVAMAAYTRGQPLAAIPITIAMASHVITCSPGDEVSAVEKSMAASQIRRVPVVDDSGHPVGMVSLNGSRARRSPDAGHTGSRGRIHAGRDLRPAGPGRSHGLTTRPVS